MDVDAKIAYKIPRVNRARREEHDPLRSQSRNARLV